MEIGNGGVLMDMANGLDGIEGLSQSQSKG